MTFPAHAVSFPYRENPGRERAAWKSMIPGGWLMISFDLHYHANVAGLTPDRRSRRLEAHREHFVRNEVAYVASTEHSYKSPTDAFCYLSEAVRDLPTEIIPGMECVSKEGIDILFLFRDEDELRSAARTSRPFGWSVHDVDRVAEQMGALVIVPHPFFLSSTSAGTSLPLDEYMSLLEKVDYVEIHNGAAVALLDLLENRPWFGYMKNFKEKVEYTVSLPADLRGRGLGWSVGSDAHFPGDQYVAGVVDETQDDGTHFFDLLKTRLRFDPVPVQSLPGNMLEGLRGMLSTWGCACQEGITKRRRKLGIRKLAAI